MDCPDDNTLNAYGAGHLPPDAARALEAHLDGCELCRQLASEAIHREAPPPDDGSGEPDDEEELSAPLEPGTRLGRYLLLERAGSGAMGTVFRAYDPTLERNVAVKLLHAPDEATESPEDQRVRLLQEAQAMARLNHPNVVTVHDVGEWRGRVFLAMEYVEGQTLRHWMQDPAHDLAARLETMLAAGRGLAAAHAAGLVHRDFKPDNVLIGHDGRVCVTDFGLARAKTSAAELTSTRSRDEVLPVWERLEAAEASVDSTHSGIIVGTPAYMAPEQLSGHLADAISDQFSFCVTTWEVLLGERPFELEALRQLAVLQLQSSHGLEPGHERRRSPRLPGGPGVPSSLPAHLGKSLLRGLSATADSRFPSMEALLTALADDPAKRRRQRWQLALVITVVLASGSALAWQQHQSTAARCSGGRALIAEVWNPTVRETLSRGFAESGVPEGAAFSREVIRVLDTYGERWASQHRAACEATRVRGDQTLDELSLRMGCLSRRRGEFRELVNLLAAAEEDAVRKSVDAATGLPGLALCENLEALREPVPPPTTPEAVAALERVNALLAAGIAQRLAGRFEPSLSSITKAREALTSLSYRPTEAEVLYEEGFVRSRLGQEEQARALLFSATLAADAGRSDHLKVRAALRLTYLSIWDEGEEAETWLRFAAAALERVGGDTELRGELTGLRAVRQRAAGQLEAALQSNREALRLVTAALGSDHPKTAIVKSNMADVMVEIGDPAGAIPLLEASIRSTEKAAGPRHHRLTSALTSLSIAQLRTGAFEASIETAKRAAAITEEVFGRDSARAADQLDYVGTAYQAAGRFEEALAVYSDAVARRRAREGEDSADLLFSLDGVGQSLAGLGRWKEARETLEAALALPVSPAHQVAKTQLALAKVLLQQGEPPGARSMAERAERHFIERKDEEGAEQARALLRTMAAASSARAAER